MRSRRQKHVDNTEEFTAVEFCAGYLGIHLGLQRVIPNLRVIAYSEIEAFAVANLVAKMEAGLVDSAPIWTNLKTFPCEQFCDRVDLLVAGYPCQPFSHAGKRSGAEDPRHLWPGVKRAIRLFRPRSCFFENVEGHLTLGFKDVCHDLDELGYRVTAGLFTASEVGAPHKRKRLFILAKLADSKTKEAMCEQSRGTRPGRKRFTNCCWPSRPGESQYAWEPPRVVDDTMHGRHKYEEGKMQTGRDTVVNASSGKTQSPLGRSSDGPPGGMDYAELCVTCDNRTDELRLLGNGVVPAVVAKAWITLMAELTRGENE